MGSNDTHDRDVFTASGLPSDAPIVGQIAAATGDDPKPSKHSVHLGPWEWQGEDGGFVDDGILTTGIIVAGVLLMAICFCSFHFLRHLGLCNGITQGRPRTVAESYREIRQQQLDEIFARYGPSGRSHPNSRRVPSGRGGPRYSHLASHPTLPASSQRACSLPSSAGVDVQRNPHSGRYTYIRFSPSGIRYTNQSILVPRSGLRRDLGDRRPVMAPRGGTQPLDMQRTGSRVSASMAFSSPWASDSLMDSSYVSLGRSGDGASGIMDGFSVGSRSEDLQGGVQDGLGAVMESSELPESDPEAPDPAVGDDQQLDFVDIPELYLCPITQDLMEDPVLAADGFTYERRAIMEWLKGHRRSPMTNEPMAEIVLIANHGLKSAITEWRMRH